MILKVVLLVTLSFLILGCTGQPENTSYFGDSQQATYQIDVYANRTVRTNLTFYYDTGQRSNWVEITNPAPPARLVSVYDEGGPIQEIRPRRYIFEGEIRTSSTGFNLRTNYRPSGLRPITLIYELPLPVIEYQVVVADDAAPPTREPPGHGLSYLQTAVFRPFFYRQNLNATFEINFPPEFYVYAASALLTSQGEEVPAEFTARTVHFSDDSLQSLTVKFLADLDGFSPLKFKEAGHYLVASPHDEDAQWVKEKVDSHFPAISRFTGLPSPYSRLVVVFPLNCSSAPSSNQYLGDGVIVFSCLLFSDVVIHETTHGFLEFLQDYTDSSWFNEGSATYSQKFVNTWVKFLDYSQIKELYTSGFVFHEDWAPGKEAVDPKYRPINYYMYSAFIIDAYVQEYGEEALREVYRRLKEKSKDCNSQCSSADIITVMIEASGKSLISEDILYPYRPLFFSDQPSFLKKIEPLAKNVYCRWDEFTRKTYCFP